MTDPSTPQPETDPAAPGATESSATPSAASPASGAAAEPTPDVGAGPLPPDPATPATTAAAHPAPTPLTDASGPSTSSATESAQASVESAQASTVSWSSSERFSERRLWPAARAERIAIIIGGVVTFGFVLACMGIRYSRMFDAWSADGDQAQAVWQYWRYHIAGVYPPGDLLTDYAFVMHAPPVWWALMASLSEIFTPLTSAKILNVVGVLAGCAAIWYGVSKRSHPFIGYAAVFLLMRQTDFTGIVAGGYARSFGPALTLAFLAAFMLQRHKTALAILVFQAAFYPSVVIPCGLAYGAYTVIKGPTMRARLRRMAGMTVAGLLIIGFGEFQEIAAPQWWGKLVWLDEALQMPSWRAGGRISEAPLKPMERETQSNAARAFRMSGHPLLPGLAKAVLAEKCIPAYGLLVVVIVASAVVWRVRKRKGDDEADLDTFPWQIPALFLAAFCAYVLARQLAFKLYLPYRPLQHVWAYMVYAGIPLAVWALVQPLVKRRAIAIAVAFAASVVPMFVVFGEGLEPGPGTYGSYEWQRGLLEWAKKQPPTKQFAGEFRFVGALPLFAHARVYVNKNLAHPFRKGYYEECERRIRLTYAALYAGDFAPIIKLADDEHVDFLVYRGSLLDSLDDRLFQPVRRDMAALFNKNKNRLALDRVPASALAFHQGDIFVVDIHKLKEAVARGEVAAEPPAPPAPFIGPALPPLIGPVLEPPSASSKRDALAGRLKRTGPIRLPIRGGVAPPPSAEQSVEEKTPSNTADGDADGDGDDTRGDNAEKAGPEEPQQGEEEKDQP